MSGLEVPKRRIWMLPPLETSERNSWREWKKTISCKAQGERLIPAMGSGTASWVCWGSSMPRGWQETRPSRWRTDTTTASQVLGLLSCGVKSFPPRQRSSKCREDTTDLGLTNISVAPSRFLERKQTSSFSLFTHNISVLGPSLIPSLSSDPNHARHRYGTRRKTHHPRVTWGE